MKIETKIAKNGTKMYYVRDNDKLTRISHDKAKEVNENNLIEGLGNHNGYVGNHNGYVSTATCILCVTVKDEFRNGDFGHGMYFDTVDNAVNAARTIATHGNFVYAFVTGDAKHFHNKRLFTINADKTEEFTDAYCQFKSAETATVEEKTERAERHAAYIARVEAERANKVAEYTLVAGNEEDAIRAEYEAAFFADDEDDEPATVKGNRFMVTAYYSCTDAQGRNWNGMDEGQCATAQAAAEWFINFAKEHPGYIIKSTSDTCIHGKVMSSIYDRKTRKEYGLTDADIAALKPADAEGMRTVTVTDDTVKFFNGNFYSVFSAKYRAAIVHRLDGIISYRLCNSEGENNSEHDVSYDNFISTLAERGAWYIASAEAQANSGVITPLTRQDRERELLALVNMRDLAADEDERAAINESINQLRRELINEIMNNAGETTAPNDEPAPESPAPAETVIETKITSNNNIVVKLNGKRASVDEAKNAILGRDYQINPVKIIDELGEVFIGGTDSDNTVYVFKWERCGQVFEIPFGTNPIQLIARRDLADYRETPASVKTDPAIEWPKLDSPSTDDFAAKLAALKAKQAGAKAKLDEKTAAREQAQKAVEDAHDAEEMAYAEWRAAADEFKRLLNGKAKELTDTLWELPLAKIKIKSTIGKEFTCSCDWVVSTMNNKYRICDSWDFCGEYDTPEQVIDVITALSNAIKRGDTEFTFPTVNQSAEPAIADEAVTTEPAAESATAKFIAGQCYRNMDWSTFGHGGKVYKVTKRTAKYVYIATYSEYYGKWVGGDDKETDRYFVRENDGNEYVEYWDGERICAKFNDEQITKPAIDRAQIETTTIDDDRDVFSLLPKLEGLNDHTETDPWLADDPAEYTDRDDRYNRGEKIAADLTAKLRRFDPTVEVTFDINEDDTDVFYLEYDGIYRTPFTVDGVEPSFHAMKQYHAEKDKTQIEDSLTRAMETALEHYKGFCHIGNLTKAEHELKLYEICRKATRELWEE